MGDRRYVQQALEHGAQVDHRRRRAGLVNDVWPHKRQHMEATGARNTPRLALSRALLSSPWPKENSSSVHPYIRPRVAPPDSDVAARLVSMEISPRATFPTLSTCVTSSFKSDCRVPDCHGRCPIHHSLHASRSRAVTATQPLDRTTIEKDSIISTAHQQCQ